MTQRIPIWQNSREVTARHIEHCRQDRWGLPVPIGVGNVRVAKAGAERHEMPGDRSAEGVAQIVDARIPPECAPLRLIRSRSCRNILRTML